MLWALAAMGVALWVSFGDLSLSYGLASARKALRERRAEQAVSVLERHADRGATSAEWQFLLARAQRRTGKLGDAEKQLARARALGWNAEDIRREELLLKAMSGQVKEVEPELFEVVGSGASDEAAEDIYEAMTQGYWASCYPGDALRCLEFWSAWQPDNLVPQLWIAELYERTGRPDEAIVACRQILEHDPSRHDVRVKLGVLLLKKLEIGEAADVLARCLADVPDNPDVVVGLAECRRRQGSDNEAKELLYEALTLDLSPDQAARATGLLGALALEERDYGRAVQLLRDSVSRDANEPDTHTSLAAALTALGQEEMAAAERQRARNASDLRTRYARATKKVLDDPGNADLRCEAGLILLEQGSWSEAADWLMSALEIDPKHHAALEGLAKLNERAGDLDQIKRRRSQATRATGAAASASSGEG